jgi:TrmH family RNA methyltransferase
MDLGRIRVILVRPRNSGNVGAAARALKNMGLGRLVLVAPHRFDQARAAEMAVHAADLVDHRCTVSTVREAVADCGLVVGTTSRPSAVRRGALTPRVAAREMIAASVLNDVALLFGPEDHGLSGDELELCHRVASIPASGEYASLNLAQAVLLCAYEVFLAAGEVHFGGDLILAPGERTEFMYTKLEEAFRAVGFLHAGNVEHMMRTIRRILGRSGLSEHDVRVFLAMARRVRWAGSRSTGSEPRRLRAGRCSGQRDGKVDTTGCDR